MKEIESRGDFAPAEAGRRAACRPRDPAPGVDGADPVTGQLQPGRPDSIDRDMRDWLRSLAVRDEPRRDGETELSAAAADYLAGIAVDRTLAAALAEIAATEPELAG